MRKIGRFDSKCSMLIFYNVPADRNVRAKTDFPAMINAD